MDRDDGQNWSDTNPDFSVQLDEVCFDKKLNYPGNVAYLNDFENAFLWRHEFYHLMSKVLFSTTKIFQNSKIISYHY